MDINLLISLISDIHQKTDLTEAILVFLPGYEEIVNVKENLEHNVSNMKICMLHSQLNSRDQKQAFAKFRNDRKVVLATNIAETSLTIDDVTVVIDAGKKTSLYKFKPIWTSLNQFRQVWSNLRQV